MSKSVFSIFAGIGMISALVATSAFAAPSSSNIHESINANMDASKVRVLRDGDKVYLRGYVSSVDELSQAADIARSAQGVQEVINQMDVYTTR